MAQGGSATLEWSKISCTQLPRVHFLDNENIWVLCDNNFENSATFCYGSVFVNVSHHNVESTEEYCTNNRNWGLW